MRLGKKTDRCEGMKAIEREYEVAELARKALEDALTQHSDLLTAEGQTIMSHSAPRGVSLRRRVTAPTPT